MALDTARTEMESTQETIELLNDIEHTDRRDPIKYWARALGLRSKWANKRDWKQGYQFYWNDEDLNHPLSNFNSSRRDFCGTFDHKQAMSREDLHFFGPGHILIDALIRTLDTNCLSSPKTGRSWSPSQRCSVVYFRSSGTLSKGVTGRTLNNSKTSSCASSDIVSVPYWSSMRPAAKGATSRWPRPFFT